MRRRRIALLAALVLLVYLVAVGSRAVLLLRSGGAVAILLGLALLALPVFGAWAGIRELRFGVATEILGEELHERGELPVDDLPRTRGGRIERGAADAWFQRFRGEVEAEPESWAAWYRLSLGYDATGDRKRARAAMRRAIDLHGPLTVHPPGAA